MPPHPQAPRKHTLAEWTENLLKSRWVRSPDLEEALLWLLAWPITTLASSHAKLGVMLSPFLQPFDRGQ